MAATHVAEVAGTVPGLCSFKVHHVMCTELMRLVDRTSSLLPEIEAARPRSATGLHAFNLLNSAIQKAKLLLQNCSESGKLYLISLLIDDLSAATFVLDPHEEEAGKVMRELLQKGTSTPDSIETSEIKALQLAASRLHITSAKSILIERRSIKKLLDKVSEDEPTKKKILTYFLFLFKKYGNLIILDQTESGSTCDQASVALENFGEVSLNNQSGAIEPQIEYRQHEVESNVLGRTMPPEDFKCPLSSSLMYDPVLIDSGKTYERMWIQKWFDKGHETCPITKMRVNRSDLLPNAPMKALISKWCAQYKVKISDPIMEP